MFFFLIVITIVHRELRERSSGDGRTFCLTLTQTTTKRSKTRNNDEMQHAGSTSYSFDDTGHKYRADNTDQEIIETT